MKIYAYNQEKWDKELKKPRLINEAAAVNEYHDVIVEPIRKIEGKNKLYEGGVCDSQGSFIAGFRSSYDNPNSVRSCIRSYEVDLETVEYCDEDVIFGGILNEHFGHMLYDSSSRLWYIAQRPTDERKVVFIANPANAVITPGDVHYQYLELLGIDQDRVVIVEEPTRFSSITIPDQALYPQGNVKYRKELKNVHRALYSHVKPGPYEKIYLTRSGFKDKNPIVGEEYYENIFRDLGYKIIAPERHPFKEQLSFIAGAKSIACTAGTLSLSPSFSPYAQEIIALKRSYEFRPGLISQGLWSEGEMYLIDANINFLPEVQGNGAFLLGDNPSWQRFLNDRPDIKEVADRQSYDIEKKAWEYVKLWTSYSTTPSVIRAQRNITYADFIKRMTFVLKGEEADTSRIEEYWENSPLSQQRKEAEKKLERLLKENDVSLKSPPSRTYASIRYEGSLCRVGGWVDLPFVDHDTVDASLVVCGVERDEVFSFEWEWREAALEWCVSFDVFSLMDVCAHEIDLCNEVLNTLRIALVHKGEQLILQPLIQDRDEGFVFSRYLGCDNGFYLIRSGDKGVLSLKKCPIKELDAHLASAVITSAQLIDDNLSIRGSFSKNCYAEEDSEVYLVLARTVKDYKDFGKNLAYPVALTFEHSKIVEWETCVNLDKIHEFCTDNQYNRLACGLLVDLDDKKCAAQVKISSASSLAELKSTSYAFENAVLYPSQNKKNAIFFFLKTLDSLLQGNPRTFVNRFGVKDDGFMIAGWIKSHLCIARGFSLSLTLEGDDVSIDLPLSFETDYSKGYFTRWNGFINCKEALSNQPIKGDLVFRLKIACEKGTMTVPLGSPCSDGARIAIAAASCLDGAVTFFNRLHVGFGLTMQNELPSSES